MDEPEQVDKLVKELIPLVERYGFNLWLNIAKFFKGWSASRKGEPKGLEEMEEMMLSFGGQEIDKTMFLGLLASAYIDYEKYEEAVSTIETGLSQTEVTGENYYKAELLRLKANLVLKFNGDLPQCNSLLKQAVGCAKSQSATSWLKKAEHDLAVN